ncbi:hypothetical protein PHYSODRAFT_492344 [Phytophthora sojae]|uniref:Tyr recombinase domain-containing protein n=1 Tax=Phytophthora sojae (strain P6497) TaxID=1094619 RepID=G4Z6M8_PHYSP|nr:hypothetical protein PHYSODRAFT_492344 [Phytophthora sojae]EGZ19598.1 hypothetical protein PHYSODRAFT_492344 [Phytophthora sojae]|eukprot:XP_009522315.1 hypothetical protein PHYSODRAFT_492344 [Phytophthora sojae]
MRKAYDGSWSPFNNAPLPIRPDDNTTRHGSNGSPSVGASADLPGYQSTIKSRSLSNWCFFAIDRWSPTCSDGRVGSTSSVHAQVSHVKWHHKVYAGFEPVISPNHATAFAGKRRISPPPRPRSPVTRTMLEWMSAQIDYTKPKQRLFLGAALLGFFYLLRSSEYLAIKGGRHRYALEVRDVEVLDITGNPAVNFDDAVHAVITLRGSKTDKRGEGSARYLSRYGHGRVCPVIGASLLLELARRHRLRPTDPICSFSKSRMLKAEEMSKALKAAAIGTGIDPQRISCHSLRSGGASALIAGGADSTTIKLHGRWKSSVFQSYTHYTQELGAPLAAMMAGNGDLAFRDTSTTRRNGVHA